MTFKRIAGPTGFLHVDDGGTAGVAVVFVHSFAGNGAHWSAQLAHLRPKRRAVAFDLRGHGQSQSPARDDYAVESLAGDIAAVVDGLGIKRFVLVGHSMGGPVAIAYASAHSERVAGLVVVGAPGKVPAEQARQTVAALESDYGRVYEGFWNKLLTGAQPQVKTQVSEGMRTMPRDTAMSIIKAMFQYDSVAALNRYHGPKLAVITSQGDESHALHKLVSDLPHRQIADTSHWMHMDKPEEFNRILDGFLQTIA